MLFTLVKNIKPKSLKIGSKNLDNSVFKLKIYKKHLELQSFQQLCSMRNAYISKMYVNVLELLL